mmetsp:Transcript_22437/g.42735  ORF Transcript_22437/g.42735 Transcript_22437/m.42735 type:complete len:553 (-) Transcript_22437:262-1920(-)
MINQSALCLRPRSVTFSNLISTEWVKPLLPVRVCRGSLRTCKLHCAAHEKANNLQGPDGDPNKARSAEQAGNPFQEGVHPEISTSVMSIAPHVACIAVAAGFALSMPAPAHAAARRHTRRRDDRRRWEDESENQKNQDKEAEGDAFTITIPSLTQIQKGATRTYKTVVKEADVRTRPVRQQLKELGSRVGFSEQVRVNKDGSFVTLVPRAPPALKTGIGYTAALMGMVLIWKLVFPSSTSKQTNPPHQLQKGRWIKDRSLGGKEIFIWDEVEEARPAAAGAARQWRKTAHPPPRTARAGMASPLDDEDARSERAQAAKQRESQRQLARKPRDSTATEDELAVAPDWWETQPPSYVPESQKEYRQKQSQMMLKKVLDKRLQGMDIDEFDLLELRQSCQDNNARLSIPQASIRDSLYRAAVEVVLKVASQGTTVIGTTSPRRFICGLANDLGVPQHKATKMLRAGQAAKARGLLLSTTASVRSGDTVGAMTTMRELVLMMSPFPPQPNSPEMDMVGSGLIGITSEKERATLLDLFGHAGGDELHHVGEEILLPR